MSDDAPTESGQEQATDTADESMVDRDHEGRESHPDAAGEGTHGSVEPVTTRETAPMSDFSGRQAAIGAVVALVGLAVTFAVPLVLTLG